MMIKSALNLLLSLHSREVTLKRIGNTTLSVTVKMASSNYFRNLDGPSETVMKGREFVVSKDALDLAEFPRPSRGDKIIHPEMGTLTISEIVEMVDIGSIVIAYRLRTG